MKPILLLLMIAPLTFGWGPVGHHTVARIAENNLNPKARAAVRELLGVPMADVAVWADEIRSQRRETGPWHYINIPVDSPRATSATFCPKEGCVSAKITELVATLKTSANRDERVEALKFLIHFVGDMHQPLHSGDKHDRGGNDVKAVFFGEDWNLHSIWDSGLLKHIDTSEDHLLRSLKLSRGKRNRMAQGTVEDWVWEAHDVARDVVYKNVTAQLGDEYLKASAPSVRLQLQRGGVRLAKLLNETLGN